MEVAEHIDALRREGELLAAAVTGQDPDTGVRTCPGWRLRDLVRHVGMVHRWAAAHVSGRRPSAIEQDELDRLVGAWPADAELVDWFREGHLRLLGTLETADPDVACWAFLPAPSPLAFWARRQAHETGVHRIDAESPGGRMTPFEPRVAVDGIDELLYRFAVRSKSPLRADPGRSLHVHATDIAGEWLVLVGPRGVEVRSDHAKGDCAVRGAASELFALLWNRRPVEGMEVFGDAAVLDLWRRLMQVRW